MAFEHADASWRPCCGLQAIKLYKKLTPESIITSRHLRLQQCITPRVELRSGSWHYPEPQTLGPGLWSQRRFQALVQHLTRLPLPGRALVHLMKLAQVGLGRAPAQTWCYYLPCCCQEHCRHKKTAVAPISAVVWHKAKKHGSFCGNLSAGTPLQRKRLAWASLTGVVGSIYVVGVCVLLARNPSISPFSLLSKL